MFATPPQHVPLAQRRTPLQLLERVSQQLGTRVWVKRDDLTGVTLSGNKVRKLEYLVADAQSEGAQVLMTCGGVQSNHCRATALVAAQLGMRAHLILRGQAEPVPDGNLLLDQLAGASVAVYSPEEYQRRLPELFLRWQEQFAKEGLESYAIPTGGSNEVGLWGYLDGAQELHDQLARLRVQPDWIVCASGSGGTQAGLTLGFSRLDTAVGVVGIAVCDSAEYFRKKVEHDVAAWASRYQAGVTLDPSCIHTWDNYIGPGYGEAGPEVYDTIAWLARTEGLVLDPVYTGKAFHGMVQEIRRGRLQGARDLVFVHTGGIFGLFPHRAFFQAPGS